MFSYLFLSSLTLLPSRSNLPEGDPTGGLATTVNWANVVVIDPCQGSATTGAVALSLGAKYLGNDKYRDPPRDRLTNVPTRDYQIKKWAADLDPASKVTEEPVETASKQDVRFTAVDSAHIETLSRNLGIAIRKQTAAKSTHTTTSTADSSSEEESEVVHTQQLGYSDMELEEETDEDLKHKRKTPKEDDFRKHQNKGKTQRSPKATRKVDEKESDEGESDKELKPRKENEKISKEAERRKHQNKGMTQRTPEATRKVDEKESDEGESDKDLKPRKANEKIPKEATRKVDEKESDEGENDKDLKTRMANEKIPKEATIEVVEEESDQSINSQKAHEKRSAEATTMDMDEEESDQSIKPQKTTEKRKSVEETTTPIGEDTEANLFTEIYKQVEQVNQELAAELHALHNQPKPAKEPKKKKMKTSNLESDAANFQRRAKRQSETKMREQHRVLLQKTKSLREKATKARAAVKTAAKNRRGRAAVDALEAKAKCIEKECEQAQKELQKLEEALTEIGPPVEEGEDMED
jgi:hypothetical protein